MSGPLQHVAAMGVAAEASYGGSPPGWLERNSALEAGKVWPASQANQQPIDLSSVADRCGTGKSHIAQALGHCAVRQGIAVMFTTCAGVVPREGSLFLLARDVPVIALTALVVIADELLAFPAVERRHPSSD